MAAVETFLVRSGIELPDSRFPLTGHAVFQGQTVNHPFSHSQRVFVEGPDYIILSDIFVNFRDKACNGSQPTVTSHYVSELRGQRINLAQISLHTDTPGVIRKIVWNPTI